MTIVKVINLKCGGCAKTIMDALKKEGLQNVKVNEATKEIAFEGDEKKACEILSRLGYPKEGSEEAKSLLKKAKSYVSCAIGKMKK